jgi:hypothetical protein
MKKIGANPLKYKTKLEVRSQSASAMAGPEFKFYPNHSIIES